MGDVLTRSLFQRPRQLPPRHLRTVIHKLLNGVTKADLDQALVGGSHADSLTVRSDGVNGLYGTFGCLFGVLLDTDDLLS